jgi:hypothetical protein
MKKSLPIIFSVAILLVIFIVFAVIKNHRSGGEVAGSDASSSQIQGDDPALKGADSGHPEGHNQIAAGGSSGSSGSSLKGDALKNEKSHAESHPSDGSSGSALSAAAGGVTQSATGASSVALAPNAASASKASAGDSGGPQGVPAAAPTVPAAVVANGVPVALPGGAVVTKFPVQANIPSCARVTFQNQEKEFKVKRHELTLLQKIESKKELCVTVNGEGVAFDLQKGSKIVFDYRMKSKGDVVATYCLSGACKLSCPKVKKDFFDQISGESSDEVIQGFAGTESAEEKKLQKELASLQKLLKEPNDKRKIIEWSEGARNEGPCPQVIQVSKY